MLGVPVQAAPGSNPGTWGRDFAVPALTPQWASALGTAELPECEQGPGGFTVREVGCEQVTRGRASASGPGPAPARTQQAGLRRTSCPAERLCPLHVGNKPIEALPSVSQSDFVTFPGHRSDG